MARGEGASPALLAVFLGLAALYALATGLQGARLTLTVYCLANKQLLVLHVPPGSNVTVAFTHSVHLTPERDVLRVTPRGFYLAEVWLREHGAGVPANPGEVGGRVWRERGGFVVYEAWAPRGSLLLLDLVNAKNMTVSVGGAFFDARGCPGRLLVALPPVPQWLRG